MYTSTFAWMKPIFTVDGKTGVMSNWFQDIIMKNINSTNSSNSLFFHELQNMFISLLV